MWETGTRESRGRTTVVPDGTVGHASCRDHRAAPIRSKKHVRAALDCGTHGGLGVRVGVQHVEVHPGPWRWQVSGVLGPQAESRRALASKPDQRSRQRGYERRAQSAHATCLLIREPKSLNLFPAIARHKRCYVEGCALDSRLGKLYQKEVGWTS